MASDDDVVFIEETPAKRTPSPIEEVPAAKRQRTNGHSERSQIADESSGTVAAPNEEDFELVAERVNTARVNKGKFPVVNTNEVKNEQQPVNYQFEDEDFFDLLGLTESQLDSYAAGGSSGASSSRQIERRAAKVAAFRRWRPAQQAQEGPQTQQQQHSAAGENDAIVIADSEDELENGNNAAYHDEEGQHAAEATAAEQLEAADAPQQHTATAVAAEQSSRQHAEQQRRPQRQPQRQQAHQLDDQLLQDMQQQEQRQQRQPAAAAAGPSAVDTRQHQQQRRPPRPRPQQQQQPQQAPAPEHQQQQQQQQVNPSDDVLLRRKLRQHITNEMLRAEREKDQLTNANSGRLLGFLEHAVDIGEKAVKAREAAKHTELFAMLTGMGADMLRGAKSESSGRRPIDLVNALAYQYRINEYDSARPVLDWKRMGGELAAARLWRTAPGVNGMLGPMHAATKVRRVAQRRPREAVAPQVKPIDNPHEETGATQETDHWMSEMRDVLADYQGQRVPLIRLVVNHDSFSQTVENIFALSFLVKDAWVRIEEDRENGLQVVNITKQQRAELKRQDSAAAAGGSDGRSSSSSGVMRAKQFMMEVNMEIWQAMCKILPRGQGLMPHRAAAAAAGQQQQRRPVAQRQPQRR